MKAKEFIKANQGGVLLNEYTLKDVIWFMENFNTEQGIEKLNTKQLKTLLRSYGHKYYKIAHTPEQNYDLIDVEFIDKINELIKSHTPTQSKSAEEITKKANEYTDTIFSLTDYDGNRIHIVEAFKSGIQEYANQSHPDIQELIDKYKGLNLNKHLKSELVCSFIQDLKEIH